MRARCGVRVHVSVVPPRRSLAPGPRRARVAGGAGAGPGSLLSPSRRRRGAGKDRRPAQPRAPSAPGMSEQRVPGRACVCPRVPLHAAPGAGVAGPGGGRPHAAAGERCGSSGRLLLLTPPAARSLAPARAAFCPFHGWWKLRPREEAGAVQAPLGRLPEWSWRAAGAGPGSGGVLQRNAIPSLLCSVEGGAWAQWGAQLQCPLLQRPTRAHPAQPRSPEPRGGFAAGSC